MQSGWARSRVGMTWCNGMHAYMCGQAGGSGVAAACVVHAWWGERGGVALQAMWAGQQSIQGQQTLLMAQGSSCGAWVEWGTGSTEEGGWIGCRRPAGPGNPGLLCALKRMGMAWHWRQDRLACASRLHNETG